MSRVSRKGLIMDAEAVGLNERAWNSRGITDPDPTFVEFPPIKMEEEDQTISKETIEKLRLTEDDLKARGHCVYARQ